LTSQLWNPAAALPHSARISSPLLTTGTTTVAHDAPYFSCPPAAIDHGGEELLQFTSPSCCGGAARAVAIRSVAIICRERRWRR